MDGQTTDLPPMGILNISVLKIDDVERCAGTKTTLGSLISLGQGLRPEQRILRARVQVLFEGHSVSSYKEIWSHLALGRPLGDFQTPALKLDGEHLQASAT